MRVAKPFYDLSLRLAADFPESRRLHMHIDSSEEESVLIYPFYQHTLLGMLQQDPEISGAAKKKVLQETGDAMQELHSKDWIHRGTITSSNQSTTTESQLTIDLGRHQAR